MSIPEQAVSIPAGTWQADVVRSSLAFEGPYMRVPTFSGTVDDFQATLTDDTLTGTAEIASLVTADENLQAQLLAPEFLDAERHPTATFSGTAARSEGAQVEFAGEITIKGISQPAILTGTLTGPVVDSYGNERYRLSLTTTIDRARFGIAWDATLPEGSPALADEVTLQADLSLVKA
jgi:polyisoprenoid-binding protein YceI